MTLPADRIGDKGQRFQVEALSLHKKKCWARVGWAADEDGAIRMENAIAKHPCVDDTRTLDRQTGKYLS